MTDIDELASGAEGRIEEALSAAMESAIDRYEQEDVLALPDGFKESLADLLADVWLTAAERAGEAMIEEHRSYGFSHLETKADEATLFERIRDMFIERYGAAKVSRIFETTRNQLLQMVLEGQQEGLGIDAIARNMRDAVPELSRLRASVIARTETHGANRFANQMVARESTSPMTKEWVIVQDSRTRDFGEGDGEIDGHNHRVMNGVKLPIDMPYMVPTKFGTREPLMFPGDPNGSPGNIINCRCGEVYRRADRT